MGGVLLVEGAYNIDPQYFKFLRQNEIDVNRIRVKDCGENPFCCVSKGLNERSAWVPWKYTLNSVCSNEIG